MTEEFNLSKIQLFKDFHDVAQATACHGKNSPEMINELQQTYDHMVDQLGPDGAKRWGAAREEGVAKDEFAPFTPGQQAASLAGVVAGFATGLIKCGEKAYENIKSGPEGGFEVDTPNVPNAATTPTSGRSV